MLRNFVINMFGVKNCFRRKDVSQLSAGFDNFDKAYAGIISKTAMHNTSCLVNILI